MGKHIIHLEIPNGGQVYWPLRGAFDTQDGPPPCPALGMLLL